MSIITIISTTRSNNNIKCSNHQLVVDEISTSLRTTYISLQLYLYKIDQATLKPTSTSFRPSHIYIIIYLFRNYSRITNSYSYDDFHCNAHTDNGLSSYYNRTRPDILIERTYLAVMSINIVFLIQFRTCKLKNKTLQSS